MKLPQTKTFLFLALLILLGIAAVMLGPALGNAQTADKPNRVTLYGGYGPDGLTIEQENNKNLIKPYLGPLAGISYARRVDWLLDGTSLSAQVLGGTSFHNNTYIGTVGVGYDW